MPYTVIIIRAGGAIEIAESSKAPGYKMLRDTVGGLIQECPYFTKIDLALVTKGKQTGMLTRGRAYANEEGIIHRLPWNAKASMLWRMSCPEGDPGMMQLHGDIIFYAKQPKVK